MKIRFCTFIIILCCFPCFAFTTHSPVPYLVAPTNSNCPLGLPDNDPKFCDYFREAAKCRCMASGLPEGMCNNMDLIFSRMISIYGSAERACQFQKDTSYQDCIDHVNCYRFGGSDSQTKLF